MGTLTPHSQRWINHTSRESMKTQQMNNTIYRTDPADTHIPFHPAAEYTSSSAQGTFSRTDDRLGCKTGLRRLSQGD